MILRLNSADTARLNAALEALLSRPSTPDLAAWWQAAEERVLALFPGARAVLSVPGDRRMWHMSASVDPQARRGMSELVMVDRRGGFRAEDPALQAWYAVRRARGLTLWNEAINARILERLGTPLDRSLWYNEALVPAGLRAFTGLTLTLPAGETFLCLGYERPGAARRGREEEMELLRLLQPAVHAGANALLTLGAQRADLAALLDRGPAAVLMVGGDGREWHRSAALRRMLDAEPERERLVAALHAMAAELRAVRERPGSAAPPTATRHVVTRLGRYAVRASYAPPHLCGDERGVEVTLTVADTEGAGPSAAGDGPDALQGREPTAAARAGLTARERDVARLLARRATDAEVAAALGISWHTARRHTERVVQKLGVSSRREVAAALFEGSR